MQLIKGLDKGIMRMSKGEKAKLTITPDFGYGADGAGGVIPPNANLIYEVLRLSNSTPFVISCARLLTQTFSSKLPLNHALGNDKCSFCINPVAPR
jgi:hypothetical protein